MSPYLLPLVGTGAAAVVGLYALSLTATVRSTTAGWVLVVAGVLVARDTLDALVVGSWIIGATDALAALVYLFTLTRSRSLRPFFWSLLAFNGLAGGALVVIPLLAEAVPVPAPGFLALLDLLVLLVIAQTSRLELRPLIRGAYTLIVAAMGLTHAVGLLASYELPVVRALLFPLAYLTHAVLAFQGFRGTLREKRLHSEREATSRNTYLQILRHAGGALASGGSLDHLTEEVVQTAVRAAGADGGALYLLDEYSENRLREASRHGDGVLADDALTDSVLQGVAATARPLYVADTSVSADTLPAEAAAGVSSFIAVPVAVDRQVLGVLAVASTNPANLFSHEDLLSIRQLASFAAVAVHHVQIHREWRERREIDIHEAIADQIQQKLLPQKLPRTGPVDVAAFCDRAPGVNGDYFAVIPLDRKKIGLVVADVPGKGIQAAIVMIMIRAILHLLATSERDPATVLAWINRGIAGTMDIDHYATLSFAVYDNGSKQVTYSSAAHTPLYVCKPATGQITEVTTEGLPLGIDRATRYAQKRFEVQPGDLLVLFSDGVVEAMNSRGVQFGSEGLQGIIRAACQKDPSAVVSAVQAKLRDFRADARQFDDQTLVALRVPD